MDEARIRPRNPTIAGFLFSSLFNNSDDERSLLRSLCFQKLTRSHAAADTVGGGSQNWWRKGWNSVRRAGEWPGSVMDYAGSHRSRLKFKYLVRKFKADSKTVYSPRPSRFQYDPPSYELNFDHGPGQDEDYRVQDLCVSAVKPGESAGDLNPRKALKEIQTLQVVQPAGYRPLEFTFAPGGFRSPEAHINFRCVSIMLFHMTAIIIACYFVKFCCGSECRRL